MKSIFEKSTRDELIARVHTLSEASTAQWGKMNVSQMIRHCSQWDEMALGNKQYKQSFIGKLFGKIGLKDMMKDEPMKKNLPTVPSFKVAGKADVGEEKNKWIKVLSEYEQYTGNGFVHPFFGFLTKEQAGIMVYKHADHHLKQFNS